MVKILADYLELLCRMAMLLPKRHKRVAKPMG